MLRLFKRGSLANMTFVTPHLLISDDDRDFRETLGRVFGRAGFATSLAADGREALRVVDREEIHVVVTDLHMPRVNGLDFVRTIRQRQMDLPCILISAALDSRVVQEAESLPVFSVLEKPFSLDAMRQAVYAALYQTYAWTPN